MDQVVDEAQSLIQSLNLTGVDGIYTGNIPEELVKDTSKTVILIQDVNTGLDDFGNNMFHTLTRQVEIQIFYKIDLDVEPSDILMALFSGFVGEHWIIAQNTTSSIDPTTKQLTQTFYFTQNKQI